MTASEETIVAARAFLSDHPEAEDALTALLEQDSKGEPWTFAEIELDSGQFGELVSRGLATSVDGGYRLQHPDAIHTALLNQKEAAEADSTSSTSARPPSNPNSSDTAHGGIVEFVRPTGIDPVTVVGLVMTLLAVAAARLVAAPAVFRDGLVVSPANDTYFFRYWQERLAARANGILDLGLFADMGAAASTRPLAHAINWWITVLFGGAEAAPMVAAWLPVAAAVCLGYVVYRLSWLLTGDVRVALAAVLFYGLAPVNVVYTSVGFLDHQAHQYLWLGLLGLALTALAVDVSRRAHNVSNEQPNSFSPARAHASNPKVWAIAAGLAVTVAASAHLWGGSPLTFVPVAAIVGLRVALDVRHDISPVFANGPTVAGITLGAGIAFAAHHWLGWHETIAVVTPLLVAGGALAVVAVGEGWRYADLPAKGLVGLEAAITVGGLLLYQLVRPQDAARFQARARDLFFREGISETASLFSPDFAVVFGPLIQLGLGFYFAVIVLIVSTWVVARNYEPDWIVVVCFGWYYLLLAAIQVRFAGQLAIFLAPLAGVGLVYLLSAIDIARPVNSIGRVRDTSVTDSSRSHQSGRDDDAMGSIFDRAESENTEKSTLCIPSDKSKRGYLVTAIALVLIFNLLLVPPLVGQTTYNQAQFDATQRIDSHADSINRSYPDNFVLSQWGDNRMYNYFVSGQAQSYGYARTTHDQFLASTTPDTWYDRFKGQVGYVVLTDRENVPADHTTYEILYEGYGVGANETPSTGHYQLLNSSNGVQTFAIVPGAVIKITTSSGEQVTVTTPVTVSNETHTYKRTAVAANGSATIRVAHAGVYTIDNKTVSITPSDVLNGNQTQIAY